MHGRLAYRVPQRSPRYSRAAGSAPGDRSVRLELRSRACTRSFIAARGPICSGPDHDGEELASDRKRDASGGFGEAVAAVAKVCAHAAAKATSSPGPGSSRRCASTDATDKLAGRPAEDHERSSCALAA